ncbi:NAD(P)-binding domain protein [Niveomyces insectorum RCEF 264]|uniref:NAD(P)-binding domain protein n=1 Tax=Niveomyces insectorum RCEF 264 TaxID=1081102 RepID=A0A167NS82_9HYPO|nr:NAD(P)-binding domain protein [Niveomyces insectorum RCEF 264]
MSLLSTLHAVGSTIFSNLFVTLPYPENAPGLSGQTVIVTGSNTGLGLEASRHLLRLGVEKLIMAVRNMEKGEKARSELLRSSKRSPDSIEVWHLDMESYDSVKNFANRATTSLPRVDVVLANAGIMTTKFEAAEGNEKTITVNVISVFYLFLLLLPKLRESPFPGTFVIPNSALHYMAPVRELMPLKNELIFARLNNPKTASMGDRYAVSKLLVLFVTRELSSRTKASAKGAVIINTPNPSYAKSELAREPGALKPPDFLARSTEMASRALVHGVLAGPESNGQYLNNCRIHA